MKLIVLSLARRRFFKSLVRAIWILAEFKLDEISFACGTSGLRFLGLDDGIINCCKLVNLLPVGLRLTLAVLAVLTF